MTNRQHINYWLFVMIHYKISREKFEPEPAFEPRTSGFLARRSTTWAILVLMPAFVQISFLRRMPLLPGTVSYIGRLTIGAILRRCRGLYTDLLTFILLIILQSAYACTWAFDYIIGGSFVSNKQFKLHSGC